MYKVRIVIDHVNLRDFLITKTLNRQEIKWWKRLFELNLRIKYRSRKLNSTDAIFKRFDYELKESNDFSQEKKNRFNVLQTTICELNTDFLNSCVLKIFAWVIIFLKNMRHLKNRDLTVLQNSESRVQLQNTKNTSSFLQRRKNFSIVKKFKSVDKKSRNNVVDSDNLQRNIVFDSILFSENAVEVTSMIMNDICDVVLLAMTERALRLKKDRKLLKSKLDEKSQKCSELF